MKELIKSLEIKKQVLEEQLKSKQEDFQYDALHCINETCFEINTIHQLVRIKELRDEINGINNALFLLNIKKITD